MEVPAWPTAELLWYQDELCRRVEHRIEGHHYETDSGGWHMEYMWGISALAEDTTNFARDAIPVVIMPASEGHKGLPLKKRR